MKTLAILAAVLVLPSCVNMPAMIREAAKDPAKVHIEVRTIYGTAIYDRDNSNLPLP